MVKTIRERTIAILDSLTPSQLEKLLAVAEAQASARPVADTLEDTLIAPEIEAGKRKHGKHKHSAHRAL